MADTFLSIQNLRKAFGPTTVVQDFNLEVRTGRVRLVPRAIRMRQDYRAAHGRRLRGADRRLDRHRRQGRDQRCKPNQRNIGMVFQAYALFPNLTVAAEHRLRLESRGRGQGRIRRARRGNADAHQAAGNSATAIPISSPAASSSASRSPAPRAPKPKLLLLDEPLSALDAKVRVSLRDEIRSIQKTLGITTVFVTHDQEEALSISDRIVVMYGGKAEQVGTPFEIYNRPATNFVANFVGTLNVLEGTVTDASAGKVRSVPAR